VNSVVALLVDRMATTQGKLRAPDSARFMISVIKRLAEADDHRLPGDLEEARARGQAILDLVYSMEDGQSPSKEQQDKVRNLYSDPDKRLNSQPEFPELEKPVSDADDEG
jgi:hypothetical protein